MSVKMVSPVEGYIPYLGRYGKRGSSKHLGLDISGGGEPKKVYAMFAGTIRVIVRGRKRGDMSSATSFAPGRTGDIFIVENPDGEFQVYNHCTADSRWKVGNKIKMGDYIGMTSLSGNTTGEHLHLEIWNKNKITRNPEIDFRYFGITVGSTPKGINNNPWPTPKPPVTPPSTGGPSATVKARLKRMGLAQNKTGVKSYQLAHGLIADGSWGTITENYYQSVVARQKYVNTWKRVIERKLTLVVDGYWGTKSKKAEAVAKTGATNKTPYKPPAFAPKRP